MRRVGITVVLDVDGFADLTISPASLTGTIANQTKVYGADDPSLAGIGVTLTGLVVNPAVSTWNGTVAIDDSALSSRVRVRCASGGRTWGAYDHGGDGQCGEWELQWSERLTGSPT